MSRVLYVITVADCEGRTDPPLSVAGRAKIRSLLQIMPEIQEFSIVYRGDGKRFDDMLETLNLHHWNDLRFELNTDLRAFEQTFDYRTDTSEWRLRWDRPADVAKMQRVQHLFEYRLDDLSLVMADCEVLTQLSRRASDIAKRGCLYEVIYRAGDHEPTIREITGEPSTRGAAPSVPREQYLGI